jgi:hypothetical protein
MKWPKPNLDCSAKNKKYLRRRGEVVKLNHKETGFNLFHGFVWLGM